MIAKIVQAAKQIGLQIVHVFQAHRDANQALFDARRENLLAPGGRVLITAFGGGLTWSASLLEVI